MMLLLRPDNRFFLLTNLADCPAGTYNKYFVTS